MPAPQYAPALVLDIVSFGYRKLIKSLLPLTKLALPFMIFATLLSAFANLQAVGIKTSLTAMSQNPEDLSAAFGMIGVALLIDGLLFLSLIAMFYSVYVSICYIRDVYYETVNPDLYSYLRPKENLLGVFLLTLLLIPCSIPAGIIAVIALIFLIVPGIAWFVFFNTCYSMLYVAYVDAPEFGIGNAFSTVWRYMQDNWLRTLGIGCVIWVVQVLISLPFTLPTSTGISLIMHFKPTLLENPLVIVLYTVFQGLAYWAQYVVGYGGVIFVLFRYYYDLQARGSGVTAIGLRQVAAANYWSDTEEATPKDFP